MKKTFTTEEIEALLKSIQTSEDVVIQLGPDPEKGRDQAYIKAVVANVLAGVNKPHAVYRKRS